MDTCLWYTHSFENLQDMDHWWANLSLTSCDPFGTKVGNGIYVFGGQNKFSKPTNTLFLIKLVRTKASLSATMNFVAAKGKPPVPWLSHNALFIENKYLMIYGGRNDYLNQLGDICLNDICLYNIDDNTWISTQIAGFHPGGRWNSSMCLNNS